MNREYYSDTITNFLNTTQNEILGELTKNSDFNIEQTQRNAWIEEIEILKKTLQSYKGKIYFEWTIPRMGKRIDIIILIGSAIFVLEFKIGEDEYPAYAIEQVCDYALDLKYFHETSHDHFIAPVLISTKAKNIPISVSTTHHNDKILFPIKCNAKMLNEVISSVLQFIDGDQINAIEWQSGSYQPTPTIVEAAIALYKGHAVNEISRSDAGAINLNETSKALSEIIVHSKKNSQKSICFVTGVPGAGKTLVGLDIATKHIDKNNGLYSVFLSGNTPLVDILREALTRSC